MASDTQFFSARTYKDIKPGLRKKAEKLDLIFKARPRVGALLELIAEGKLTRDGDKVSITFTLPS